MVNEFFRRGWVDLGSIGLSIGLDPLEGYGGELDYLEGLGAVERAGLQARITPGFAREWAYLDKLFYPPGWLESRARVKGLRLT